jgi:hypothetical protein
MISTIPVKFEVEEGVPKSLLGFNHLTITRLLMLAKHLARFDKDMDKYCIRIYIPYMR